MSAQTSAPLKAPYQDANGSGLSIEAVRLEDESREWQRDSACRPEQFWICRM